MEKRKSRVVEIKRKKFQGVLNILSFNRHFYLIGLLVFALIATIWFVFNLYIILLWIILVLFIYGFLIPLFVSAYVYDFSGYYDFEWFKKLHITDSNQTKIVNINAGFDETSFSIKNFFSQVDLKVFDFYDENKHTEPAIVRARKVSLTYPNTKQIKTNSIPLENNSVDAIFLLSAAHEIRNNDEKIQFFKECHRICKPNGKVILVEHLRNIPNFFAFSVGFTHFFSKNVWMRVFKKAGFSSITETKFTPFMSIFYLTKF